MKADPERHVARHSIWRQRGRRVATGLNAAVAVLLALVLTVLANVLASRHFTRWDWSSRNYYRLSPKTCSLIGSLTADVEAVAFFRRGHEVYDDVRNLLAEYRYEAARHRPARLKVEIIDPDRDLARTREKKREYDLTDADVVVFQCGGRRKYVDAKAISEHAILFTDGRAEKRRTAFKGEQAFSSAIQSVAQAHSPLICFVAGHGERDPEDVGRNAGYSEIARLMRRDNMEVRTLRLSKQEGIPAGVSALVIAGPDRTFSAAEVDMLSEYLEHSGRMLVLLDPDTTTGLEPLLRRWGVGLARDTVVGLTLTGRELLVTDYGEHKVTRNLRQVTTMFYMPRSVEPVLAAADVSDDKPRVTVLARSSREGWAESDPAQSPPRFDAGADRPGPIPVAVAVERGDVREIEVALRPTRLIVAGDSYFVSNGALGGGAGGNVDLFLNMVNWLVERDALLSIGPKAPDELRLEMSNAQLRAAYAIVALAVPAAVGLLGAWVGLRRRR